MEATLTLVVVGVGGLSFFALLKKAWKFAFFGAVLALFLWMALPVVATVIVAETLKGLRVPPAEALRDVENTGHHAWEHAVTPCVIHIIKENQQPSKVYFSKGAPDKGLNKPAVAFVWHADKVIRDLTNLGKLGACLGLNTSLLTEFAEEVLFKDVKLMMVVGFDLNKGFFTFSIYPVKGEILLVHLCEWGYTLEIYPGILKPVACLPGY